MDIHTEEPRISADNRINKKTVFIAAIVLVVIIGVFLGVRYSQYLDYLKTPKDNPSAQGTSGLSADAQKELDELDRLRAEYKAIFGTSTADTTTASTATTSVNEQIKSLDELRKKAQTQAQTQTQSTLTIEQQLSELDALRAKAQAKTQ